MDTDRDRIPTPGDDSLLGKPFWKQMGWRGYGICWIKSYQPLLDWRTSWSCVILLDGFLMVHRGSYKRIKVIGTCIVVIWFRLYRPPPSLSFGDAQNDCDHKQVTVLLIYSLVTEGKFRRKQTCDPKTMNCQQPHITQSSLSFKSRNYST